VSELPETPKRIRVLFAIGTMGGGGAERQVIEILKHLDREMFEPFLYLIHRTGELLTDIPEDVPVKAFWERYANMGLKFPGRIAWTQKQDMAAVIREWKIDVVYHRCYLMNLLATKAAQLAKVPHVAVTVVDPEPELKLYARFSTLWSWFRARRAYLASDLVLANSNGLRERMCDYFKLPELQVQTIHNLFDAERIDLLASKPAPDWSTEEYHIVCAARLHPQKGQHVLMQALRELIIQRQLTQLQLHLLGQGESGVELQQLAHELGIAAHVHFEGFQSNPFPMINRADLFCLPSFYEGMPNALVEAVLCRTPVVATDCPSGPAEIVESGLVPPGDPQALAQAIWAQFQSPDSLQEREQKRQSVLQRFSWQIGIQKVQDLLVDLVQKKEST